MTPKNIKIIMIEDDEDDVMIIEDFIDEINEKKHQITFTNYLNTQVALENLKSEKTDLILLDLNLIESNGVETLIRFRKAKPNVPIIVLTGLADEKTALECIREGASDYMIKGKISSDQLKRTVKYAIERFSLTKTLKKQQKALAKSNRELEQLAYASSHELKEPLGNMIGFANILASKYSAVLDDSGKKMLDYLAKESTKHYNQIQAFIHFLDAGKQKQKPTEISLDDVVYNIIANLGAKIIKENISINFDNLNTAFIDTEDAKKVFSNLIENSIKFGKKDEAIVIDINSTLTDQGNLIEVQDNGSGIEADFHKQVFNLFKKLNQTSEGIGMGLAICKKIIESYDGHISIDSELGKGTKISFLIPYNE